MKKLILILMLTSIVLTAQEPIDTDNNGYRNISTLEQLRWISENDSSWSWNFELDNDIDLSGSELWNNSKGFKPIGNNANPFNGNFNGNYHAIKNLTINRALEDTIGLFGYVNDTNIFNLSLEDCKIIGHNYIGGIVGILSFSNLFSCNISGSVNGYDIVGGIAGKAEHVKLRLSYSHANVEGHNYVGGIAGSNTFSGNISFCYVHGDISGNQYVGGIIGENKQSASIFNTYYVGELTGSKHLGGIVGVNYNYEINSSVWQADSLIVGDYQYGLGVTPDNMKDTNIYIKNYGWNFTAIWDINDTINNGYPYFNFRTIPFPEGEEPIDKDGNGYRNISTIDHLVWIAKYSTSWRDSFELDNDIDMSESKYWEDGKGFSSIGRDYNSFNGIFNGNGHTISNLYISRINQNYIGFFGIARKSNIYDLNLENIEIYAQNYSGGLIGQYLYGRISNCNVNGKIKAKNSCGGLIGYFQECIVDQCKTDVNIEAVDIIGGLVGKNFNGGSIENSTSNIHIIGNDKIGGFIGGSERQHYNSRILYINNCNSKGFLNGRNKIGGFAGYIENVIIFRSYSNTNCNGKDTVGGFIGILEKAEVDECYSSGIVEGVNTTGGFVASQINKPEKIIRTFWDIENSGQLYSLGGEGKNSEEMKNPVMYFAEAGWNFFSIWQIDENLNDGYPFLNIRINEPNPVEPVDLDGNGFRNINKIEHIFWLSNHPNSWQDNFELDNNIDIYDTRYWNNGYGFSPLGDENFPFQGVFNGNNFELQNLYIANGLKNNGFFGNTQCAEIKNLHINSAEISSYNTVGILIGFSEFSNTHNCFTSGTIYGYNGNAGGMVGVNTIVSKIKNSGTEVTIYSQKDTVGGLVGFNSVLSTVDSCESKSQILSENFVGGLVGYNDISLISNSSAVSNISGNNYVGGLVGLNNLSSFLIKNSAYGNVSGNVSIGGLVGENCESDILKCDFSGTVDGIIYIGGLVGYNGHMSNISMSFSEGNIQSQKYCGGLTGMNILSKIENCYSRCNSSGTEYIGGLIGQDFYSKTKNTYSTGSISGEIQKGGLIGSAIGTNSSYSFYDLETSQIDSSAGGTGKSTAEMKTKSTFTDAGWDFDEIWFISENVNDGYPALFGLDNPPTSVNNEMINDDDLIRISPNPAVDYIEISLDGAHHKSGHHQNIEIYDVLGNRVMSGSIHPMTPRHRMNVANLPKGVYFVRIGDTAEKFVKM